MRRDEENREVDRGARLDYSNPFFRRSRTCQIDCLGAKIQSEKLEFDLGHELWEAHPLTYSNLVC